MFLLENKKSFTIIELIVAIAVSSIIALTAGAMVYFSFSSWQRNVVSVELQRDYTFAMNMFSSVIRPARAGQIKIEDSDSTLIVGDRSFYVDSEDTLWYDPDITVSNDENAIIRNKVTQLSFVKNESSGLVEVSMTLEDEEKSLTSDFSIGYRNESY